jgi:hypothetical protein
VDRFRPSHRLVAVAVAAIVLAAIGAGAALANVLVYSNSFGTHGAFSEIRKDGGKACERKYSKKHELFTAKVKHAPRGCSFTVPVRGDSALPDHQVSVKAKVSKGTKPQKVRKGAYLAVILRLGGDHRYELRVFPKTKRYQLLRKPDGGGFPVKGTSDVIKGIGKKNELRLKAFGANIKAAVNDKRLTSIHDSNPGQVDGKAIAFALGNRAHTSKPTMGSFDSVRVAVPR